ncbi:MAG: pyruvate kinase [Chloroflexota bacterium]|nr:pyruvate kinase [Chloroflexota bacterium]
MGKHQRLTCIQKRANPPKEKGIKNVYKRLDGPFLGTKIVATIGPDGRDLYDKSGNLHQRVSYSELFGWLLQDSCSDCFMVDILRLNMSFYSKTSDNNSYRQVFDWINREKDGIAKRVALLGDLPGAKTRLGMVEGEQVELVANADFQLYLAQNRSGTQEGASVLTHGSPLSNLRAYRTAQDRLKKALSGRRADGINISIGDGNVTLQAKSLEEDTLHCKVTKAGMIRSKQGVTFERVDLGLPSFQKEDENILRFLLDLDAGEGFLAYIAVSFVRKPEDILEIRHWIENYHVEKGKTPEEARRCCPEILAKIETADGKRNISSILDVADGVMVARGDLALQLSLEDVPRAQKEIISLCKRRGKTVITATEMLASMENNPKPTRAEVNDVFNAVLDGTDAVMLSGETAKGKYPVQAVSFMSTICEQAELYFENTHMRGEDLNTHRMHQLRRDSETMIDEIYTRLEKERKRYLTLNSPLANWARAYYDEKLARILQQSTTDRICCGGCELAEGARFKAIFASTLSGRTARMVSRFLPSVIVVGVVHDGINRRKLLLSRGVFPVDVGGINPETGQPYNHAHEIFEQAFHHARIAGLVEEGDEVVSIGSTPLFQPGVANQIQIKVVT